MNDTNGKTGCFHFSKEREGGSLGQNFLFTAQGRGIKTRIGTNIRLSENQFPKGSRKKGYFFSGAATKVWGGGERRA